MAQWQAAAKETCKGGDFTVVDEPNTETMGDSDVILSVKGTIKCK
jgi:hypothetical protein